MRLLPLAILVAFLNAVGPTWAQPEAYALDAANSSVRFDVGFGKDRIKGSIPIRDARVTLDIERPENSRISVTLDTRRAVASFPFATQALRGPKVLAAPDYPVLTFRSTGLRGGTNKARIRGEITIRGVTRPIDLDAQVFRQRGAAEGDYSRMSVHLTGAVQRSAFGATGWNDMVSDRVGLDILVRLNRAN